MRQRETQFNFTKPIPQYSAEESYSDAFTIAFIMLTLDVAALVCGLSAVIFSPIFALAVPFILLSGTTILNRYNVNRLTAKI